MTDGRTTISDLAELPFGSSGRLHAGARLLGSWLDRTAELALPPAEACDDISVEDASVAEILVVRGCAIDAPDEPDEGASLALVAAAVLARWREIEAAAVPFRVTVPTAAGVVWRGVLLPFAAADGRLGAVRALMWRVDTPLGADLVDVAASLSTVGRSAPPRLKASPWERSHGAISLLSSAAVPALAPAERLGVARTWAALAGSEAGPGRGVRLHAALAAAFDLLEAVRVDAAGAEARDGLHTIGTSAAQIAEAVFGGSTSPDDLRVLALALAQGERLGLDRTGFATLLDQLPGGYRELAASAETMSGPDTEGPAPADHVEIEPVDISWLRRRAQRAASDNLSASRYAA